MRVNSPISNTEYEFDGHRSLYSTTDLKGKITYANPYFIEVSGYDEEELIGQPHNIVRHPDMPPAAFGDLWQTVKVGLPWVGMVKNRRKNGDYYWVKATVTPMVENGAITGYISVRNKATRTEIESAEQLYKTERENPGHLILRQGEIINHGRLGLLLNKLRPSLGGRIAFTHILLLLLAGFLGWSAMHASNTYSGMATILAAALVTFIGVSFYSGMRFVKEIRQATIISQHIAGGDLSAFIKTNRTDEIGQLLRAVRRIGTNLQCIIGDIRDNTNAMHASTSEIAAGNNDLSARTDSQAAALEETAASLEQIASTVQKNAENTGQAREVAKSTLSTAKGGDIVSLVVTTMDEISQSSNKISNIVDIINGISQQTNLLALNAAVEAARAGDAGRGFTVVASEVRKLAQSADAAAKDIKHLINASAERVQAGATLARNAGTSMQEIIAAVNKVTEFVQDISSASAEQSIGISQVNEAVMSMDETTQRNASLVDVATRATHGIEEQSRKLLQALAIFRIKHQIKDQPQNKGQLVAFRKGKTMQPQSISGRMAKAA